MSVLKKPKVSVLVPVFNVERYLVQCLDSICAQTLQDIEIICINDGSTDGSPDILRKYASVDARVRVIDKPNSGYGASMNRGLNEANGEYIAIVESDDFIDPDTLEIQYRTAIESSAEVIKSDFYLYWSTSAGKNKRFGFTAALPTAELVSPRDCEAIFYLKPSIWSAIYEAQFLKDNDIRFLETPGASYQDAGFNFKVWASASRVVFLDRAFLHYRQDNEASSVKSPGKVYCVCDEYAEMERYLAKHLPEDVHLRQIMLKMKYDSYMWNYERLTQELQFEFLQRVSSDFSAHVKNNEINLAMFEPWKVEDLKRIIDSPSSYHERRVAFARMGRLGKALHYLTMGGISMAYQIAKAKSKGL